MKTKNTFLALTTILSITIAMFASSCAPLPVDGYPRPYMTHVERVNSQNKDYRYEQERQEKAYRAAEERRIAQEARFRREQQLRNQNSYASSYDRYGNDYNRNNSYSGYYGSDYSSQTYRAVPVQENRSYFNNGSLSAIDRLIQQRKNAY